MKSILEYRKILLFLLLYGKHLTIIIKNDKLSHYEMTFNEFMVKYIDKNIFKCWYNSNTILYDKYELIIRSRYFEEEGIIIFSEYYEDINNNNEIIDFYFFYAPKQKELKILNKSNGYYKVFKESDDNLKNFRNKVNNIITNYIRNQKLLRILK